jgi:hypothetical protein
MAETKLAAATEVVATKYRLSKPFSQKQRFKEKVVANYSPLILTSVLAR